ncbi:serine hydrolase domain-containing protein [Marinicaulis aureus]|uniref:Serine hydrolase domain-containing protein n=1 Tax=Hyphococcus aureus TaxID=2666033 RepID=A0ABW1KZC7_9PROT
MKIVKFGLFVAGAVVAIGAWCAVSVFGGLYGWWMKPIVKKGDHQAFFAEATQIIDDKNAGNAAFILIHDGDVVGEYYAPAGREVNAQTVFPTSSFSKWVTAFGVMKLVDRGEISLDEPVSSYLTRWNLPDGAYDESAVTVRRLLSHMAGLTDGLGFGDYEPGETIPSLEETLANPRASSGREVTIEVGAEPGEEFAYSGGGYLILQLLIEEVSGQDYEGFIQEKVLAPLGMTQSSFRFIGDIEGATQSFDATGAPAPQFQYAAAGATGFSSSAADLLKLVAALTDGGEGFILQPATLASMRQPEATVFGSPIWGLGTILFAPTKSGDFIYGHDGANEPAINVSVRINPDNDDAYIMLVNGHPSLASDIGGEWVLWQTGVPDILSTERAIKSALLPAVVGSLVILILAFFLARRVFSSRKN